MIILLSLWFLEEFSKVYLLYRHLFCFKLQERKSIIVIASVLMSSLVLIMSVMEGMKKTFELETGYIILIFLFTLFCFKEKLWKKLIIFFPVYSGICIIDMIVKNFAVLVLGSSETGEWNLLTKVIFNSIGIGIIVFICFLRKALNKDNKSIFGTWQMAALIGLIVLSTAFFIAYAGVILSYKDTTFNRVLCVVFTVIWLVFLILSFIFLQSILVKEKYKMRLQMNEDLFKQQQEYYQGLLDKDEKMRRFRHDYRGHLALISDMLEQQRYSEVKAYLNSIKGVTESLHVYRTGDDIVDLVLNDIAAKYAADRIRVQVKGGFTEKLKLSNFDICTIFSNAFKNAFEAEQKSQETDKVIQVEIYRQNNRWLIEIKNATSVEVIIQDGMIATNKEDKSIHGFGIRNMKECIEKNCGMLQYSQQGHLFSTRIMI